MRFSLNGRRFDSVVIVSCGAVFPHWGKRSTTFPNPPTPAARMCPSSPHGEFAMRHRVVSLIDTKAPLPTICPRVSPQLAFPSFAEGGQADPASFSTTESTQKSLAPDLETGVEALHHQPQLCGLSFWPPSASRGARLAAGSGIVARRLWWLYESDWSVAV